MEDEGLQLFPVIHLEAFHLVDIETHEGDIDKSTLRGSQSQGERTFSFKSSALVLMRITLSCCIP